VADTVYKRGATSPWRRGSPRGPSPLGLVVESPLTSEQRAFVRRCQKVGLDEPDVAVPFALSAWQGGRADCGHMKQRGTCCDHCGATRQVWHFAWVFSGWLVLEVAEAVGPTEYQRLNAAVRHGYSVIFSTPAEVKNGSVFATIKRALAAEEEQS
jgi:hypothetical protein